MANLRDEIQSFLYHRFGLDYQKAGQLALEIWERTDGFEKEHLKYWVKDRFDGEIKELLKEYFGEKVVQNWEEFSKIKQELKNFLSSFLEEKK